MNVSVLTISPPVMGSSLPIPDDLVFEIFSRLPSKAIARCRCVSKLLASMLRSHYFTELFLTKSCARPQLLFAFEDDSEVVFFSSPQPENPEENSYVLAANQLARIPSSYGLSAPTRTEKLSWRLVECSIPHCPSTKWICINGVLYYTATAGYWSSMVVCFDFKSEKFSFVNFMEASGKEMHGSTTLINYNGKLGLLMSEDTGYDYICGASKSLELWVLRDAGKNEWSEHVYVLPPSWEDVVSAMSISGMVGTNEIVLAPLFRNVPPYVIYYNVERKTITKVGIQVMEALQGKRFYTFLNYVEDVKFL
ncbi:BnaA04g28850D [Brassica napus]|uniref:BnaA04g28850D protein n=1 Tax=Brassica napus TaxID=3708 RepID=A0A078J9X6_BRANA|nr:BnaA04g28850D [Brassica napus]